nr:hypothetical protein [uncultured Porphyromonas sp.]
MREAQIKRYRHRELILMLTLVSLGIFVLIQLLSQALPSCEGFLFSFSFSAPTFVYLTLGTYYAKRRGLERGIVAVGTVVLSALGMLLLGLLFFVSLS